MAKEYNIRQRQKYDTEERWIEAGNKGFIPLEGEIIVYSDLKKIKIGDGSTNVNTLEFITSGTEFQTLYERYRETDDLYELYIDGITATIYPNRLNLYPDRIDISTQEFNVNTNELRATVDLSEINTEKIIINNSNKEKTFELESSVHTHFEGEEGDVEIKDRELKLTIALDDENEILNVIGEKKGTHSGNFGDDVQYTTHKTIVVEPDVEIYFGENKLTGIQNGEDDSDAATVGQLKEAIEEISISGGLVQSDWKESSTSSLAFIKNKPSINPGTGSESVIMGEGQANGKYSFAGGTTDSSVIKDIVGVDINSSLFDSLIEDELGPGGVRLKERLKNSPTPQATGVSSYTFGTGNNSMTGMSFTNGAGCEAGAKGFYIHKITVPSDGSDITINLSTVQKPYYRYQQMKYLVYGDLVWKEANASSKTWNTNAGTMLSKLSVGDEVNVMLRQVFCLCGTITEIDSTNGIVKISNSGLLTQSDVTQDTEYEGAEAVATTTVLFANLIPYNFSMAVPSKPDIGIADIHFAAISSGLGSIAAGSLSQSHGLLNIAAGQFSFAIGQMNKAGYGSFVSGKKNNAIGLNSFATGSLNIVTGNQAFSAGYNNTVNGKFGFAGGYDNTVTSQAGCALGQATLVSGRAGFAQGVETTVSGVAGHAEGGYTVSAGSYAHAEGGAATTDEPWTWKNSSGTEISIKGSRAGGNFSHAEGRSTYTTTIASHTEGWGTIAVGDYQHVQGKWNDYTNASSLVHIIGWGSKTKRANIHTIDTGGNAWFKGGITSDGKIKSNTIEISSQLKLGSITFNSDGTISGTINFLNDVSIDNELHTPMVYTRDLGISGQLRIATLQDVIYDDEDIGEERTLYEKFSDFPGVITHQNGEVFNKTTENIAGLWCHAEGNKTIALNQSSHSEGELTTALGQYCHAEGMGHHERTTVTFENLGWSGTIHAEETEIDTTVVYLSTTKEDLKWIIVDGKRNKVKSYDPTTGRAQLSSDLEFDFYDELERTFPIDCIAVFSGAIGNTAHVEGYYTTAHNVASHAEGRYTIAGNIETAYSATTYRAQHAEGQGSIAKGAYSHAANFYTQANNYSTTAIGVYNKDVLTSGTTYYAKANALTIGNGTEESRSNAFRVCFNGNVYSANTSMSTGADYAEYFEWEDQNSEKLDRVGLFVTLVKDKIKIADSGDEILGVISGHASVVGDAYEDEWCGMYQRDIYGRLQYENVETTINDFDDEGKPYTETFTELRIKKNPMYDPNQTYVPRSERAEWAPVGMLGKLVIIDNGQCQVGKKCACGENGIAIPSEQGYHVLKRLDETHIQVLLK